MHFSLKMHLYAFISKICNYMHLYAFIRSLLILDKSGDTRKKTAPPFRVPYC